MSALVERHGERSSGGETEISLAAVGGYGRLLRAIGCRLTSHASRDGGLICEFRASSARPVFWRVLPDGEILPDTPYNYVSGAFVAGVMPVK